jgi:hypothetical protein
LPRHALEQRAHAAVHQRLIETDFAAGDPPCAVD